MIRNASLVVMLTACANFACAQEFPLWERILSHYSGKTDETPVPSMKMGHMQMSLKGDTAPGDAARAAEILGAADAVLSRYRDVDTAVRDGYKPFFPTGRVGEEIHYTNYRCGGIGSGGCDVYRPSRRYTGATECNCSAERRNLAPTCGLLRRPEKPADERAVRTECAFWATRQYSHGGGMP